MANYIFKKEVSLYVVYGSLKYKIDLSEISFSQTFREKSYEVKTLHNQSSFEGSKINTANPANFSFNIPLLEEVSQRVIFDRLLDYETFDLYISSAQDVFKLEKCFIQNGTFEINKSRPLRLNVEGEASKLSKFTGTIPGTLQNTSITTSTYIVPKISVLTIGGTDISDATTSFSVELQNDGEWTNYRTLQGAVAATNAATSMYPSNFTIGTRILGGSISKYLKSDSDLLDWSMDTPVRVKVGRDIGRALASVAVTSGGSGYSSPPEVTISGGGGTGATATATLNVTSVSELTITNPGTGYTSNPTLTIAGPPMGGSGSTATGTATISAETICYGLDFNISNASFTKRTKDGDIFGEEYNWRMIQNPTALSSVLTYTTL